MARALPLTCSVVLASVILYGRPASAQTKTLEGTTTTLTGTVEAIDTSQRVLTIKDSKGEYHEIDFPEGVQAFSTTKIGDRLNLRYYENIVLRVKTPGEPDADTTTAGVTRAGDSRAAGTMAKQRTITATITAIDPKIPSITFSGPNNWKYSSRVQDTKTLAKVKVGDKLDITWTTALLASLEPAK